MRPLTVVQVPRRFVASDWGGTETALLETSRALRARGHRVTIACPDALGGAPRETMSGVPVRRFPYTYPFWGLDAAARQRLDLAGGNLWSFELLGALQRWPGLDLVHLHTGKRLGGIGRYVATRRGLPYVVTLHGGVFDVAPGEAERHAEPTRRTLEWGRALGWWVGARRVLEDAEAVLCVSAGEVERARARLPGVRVEHLPNGVDAARFAQGDGARFRRTRGIPAGAQVVLTVGRIDPQKDQLLAVRALAELLPRHPHLHLILLGPVTNPGYHTELLGEARRLGVAARLHLLAGVPAGSPDLVDAYHAADLFLLPSRHEPFGSVILEAWAAGLPVVASRIGGIPAFVTEGHTGRLVEPGDLPGFARALGDLLRAPGAARARARARQAQARARHAWRAVTDQLETLYREVRHARGLPA